MTDGERMQQTTTKPGSSHPVRGAKRRAELRAARRAACEAERAATERIGIMCIDAASVQRFTAGRLVAARQLNGLSLEQAAEMLGYPNSAVLSKLEAGRFNFGTGAPIHMLQCAALLYGVSTDYLTWLSDHNDRDPEVIERLAVMRATRAMLTIAAMDAMKRMKTLVDGSPVLMAHNANMSDCFGEAYRLRLKSGIRTDDPELRAAIEKAVDAADDANDYLRRRGAEKAHEWFDDVPKTSSILSLAEDGTAGMIEALEREAARAEKFKAGLDR